MSSIKKRSDRGKIVWRAHYRDPFGRQRNKSFARKADAERYLTTVEASKLTGSYVDPGAGRITVEAWSRRWIATQGHLKPSTRARYEGVLSKQIVPRWGTMPLSAITHSDVAAWIADLGLAPATVRYVHGVFSLLIDMGVRDGLIGRNPAAGVRLPKPSKAERRFLTAEQVDALADAIGEYRLVVLTLAYCGLRWGELAALRVGRVDTLGRRLEIVEAVVEVRGHLAWGTPKSNRTALSADAGISRERPCRLCRREGAQ